MKRNLIPISCITALSLCWTLTQAWRSATPMEAEPSTSGQLMEADYAPTVNLLTDEELQSLWDEARGIDDSTQAQAEADRTRWGVCRVTAYCACAKCCGSYAANRPINPNTGRPIVIGASGSTLQPYQSCASSLSFGTKLYIPDIDLVTVVEDRASTAVHEKTGGMYVDIYMENHDEAIQFGSRWMEVYIDGTVS